MARGGDSMSAKRKGKAAMILYDETLPSADRLQAMIGALASGSGVDTTMRAEIMSALKSIQAKRLNDALRRAGTPMALPTFQAAALATVLVSNHRIRPARAAIQAAVETVRTLFTANRITIGAVARAHRTIKGTADCSMTTRKGDKYQLANITPGVIDYALARLPTSAKGTWTIRTARPPFVIAVAHLFKPERSGNK